MVLMCLPPLAKAHRWACAEKLACHIGARPVIVTAYNVLRAPFML